jgi:hypothetical protein
MILHQYEELKPVRQVWGWLAIILLTLLTAAWGMVTHMAVPDVVRHWDFDVLPDTPASSPYATLPPPEVRPVPPQIELPPNRVHPRERIE